MKKYLCLGIFVGAFMLASGGIKLAEAAPTQLSGFACDVTWHPKKTNSAFGNIGAVLGSLYSQPYCQGNFVGFYSLYSAGQTMDPSAHSHSEGQLSAIFQSLQRHITAALRVDMFGFSTNSGNPGISSVSFRALYQ
jgi:hypothetical protein